MRHKKTNILTYKQTHTLTQTKSHMYIPLDQQRNKIKNESKLRKNYTQLQV